MPAHPGRSMIATRVNPQERALIDAVARLEGQTITALLRAIVMPVVRQRIVESATADMRNAPPAA